jgi:hypothetical protein
MKPNILLVPTPHQVMMERWSMANMDIPRADVEDIVFESPHYNGDDTSLNMDAKRQHNPEFSQASYLRLRSLEEAFATHNYLDPKFADDQLSVI